MFILAMITITIGSMFKKVFFWGTSGQSLQKNGAWGDGQPIIPFNGVFIGRSLGHGSPLAVLILYRIFLLRPTWYHG